MSLSKTVTALKAIRAFCTDCQGDGGNLQWVERCPHTECPLSAYRSGKALPAGQHQPTKAIRRFCTDQCQSGAPSEEVKNCQGDTPAVPDALAPCPLFKFRFGRNPNISEKTKAARRQRTQKRVVKGRFGFLPSEDAPTP